MPTDYVQHALSLLPGFGILFFIEFVAFFFLRQYRSAMDEFRYFDAVRRNREENLVILNMFAENQEVVRTNEVLQSMKIYSSPDKLSKDETTDIVETRRLYTDEAIIFGKVLEIMDVFKEGDKDDKRKRRVNNRQSK